MAGFRSSGNKFGAEKTTVDGIKFDSKKEARRYVELKICERAGAIRDLELQAKYPLMAGHGKPIKSRTKRYPSGRQVNYFADFVYWDVGQAARVVEDVKGRDTDVSRIKRACVEAYYDLQIVLT